MAIARRRPQKRTPSKIRARGCSQFVGSNLRLLGLSGQGCRGGRGGRPAWPSATYLIISSSISMRGQLVGRAAKLAKFRENFIIVLAQLRRRRIDAGAAMREGKRGERHG